MSGQIDEWPKEMIGQKRGLANNNELQKEMDYQNTWVAKSNEWPKAMSGQKQRVAKLMST